MIVCLEMSWENRQSCDQWFIWTEFIQQIYLSDPHFSFIMYPFSFLNAHKIIYTSSLNCVDGLIFKWQYSWQSTWYNECNSDQFGLQECCFYFYFDICFCFSSNETRRHLVLTKVFSFLSVPHICLGHFHEAEEYAVEGKTLMLYFAGLLMASLRAAISADMVAS